MQSAMPEGAFWKGNGFWFPQIPILCTRVDVTQAVWHCQVCAWLTATHARNERPVSRLVVNDKAPKRNELRTFGACDRTHIRRVVDCARSISPMQERTVVGLQVFQTSDTGDCRGDCRWGLEEPAKAKALRFTHMLVFNGCGRFGWSNVPVRTISVISDHISRYW